MVLFILFPFLLFARCSGEVDLFSISSSILYKERNALGEKVDSCCKLQRMFVLNIFFFAFAAYNKTQIFTKIIQGLN